MIPQAREVEVILLRAKKKRTNQKNPLLQENDHLEHRKLKKHQKLHMQHNCHQGLLPK